MHTPLPWITRGERVVAHRPHVTGGYNEESVLSLTRPPAERLANVHLIVRAVNSHAALLAACELALPVLRDQHAALAPIMHGGVCPDREAMFAVEAALALAKGE